MKTKEIIDIIYNPFFSSKLIPHFLSGAPNQTLKLELTYFLFPFVFQKESRELLSKLLSTSTLYSAFLNNAEGKKCLINLEKRYEYFKPATNEALIIAASNNEIIINKELYCNINVDCKNEKDIFLKYYFKAAKNLGIILSKDNLVDIYIKLGVREL